MGEAHDPRGEVLAGVERFREVVLEVSHRTLAHHDAGAGVGGVAEGFEVGRVGKRSGVE